MLTDKMLSCILLTMKTETTTNGGGKMNKYNWQMQIVVNTKRGKGSQAQEMPTFILPSLLGLLTGQDAAKVACEMFKEKEVHGSAYDPETGACFNF